MIIDVKDLELPNDLKAGPSKVCKTWNKGPTPRSAGLAAAPPRACGAAAARWLVSHSGRIHSYCLKHLEEMRREAPKVYARMRKVSFEEAVMDWVHRL